MAAALDCSEAIAAGAGCSRPEAIGLSADPAPQQGKASARSPGPASNAAFPISASARPTTGATAQQSPAPGSPPSATRAIRTRTDAAMAPVAGAGPPVLVAAFYRFSSLAALPDLRRQLLQLAAAEHLRGTILLAEEGVNGTVSGPPPGVARLLERLRRVPGLEPLEAKLSWAPSQAFQRLKVRIKREIVTLGCPTVKPSEQVGAYVPPDRWDQLIDDPGTLLIDTRNSYEVAIGTFEGAIDPGTDSFRAFPAWVDRVLRPLVAERQPRAIAMFCTGGIRCEKASAYLLQQGFDNVQHLQGGILRYLEEHPEPGSRWRGECFVFDRRVSVNHRLEPGVHSLCHACGLPLAPADLQHPAYREGVSCHHCLARFSDADRARFAERQQQIERARARGDAHVGVVMPRHGQPHSRGIVRSGAGAAPRDAEASGQQTVARSGPQAAGDPQGAEARPLGEGHGEASWAQPGAAAQP